VNFRLTRGRLRSTEQVASLYRRFCHRSRTDFASTLGLGVAEDHPGLTGILRAMLLGQRQELSDAQDELFMQSGTMHLFAISGLHVGVIAAGLHALLALLPVPRAARFVATISALWLYVDITGAAPSALRAFVMIALLEAALLLRMPGQLIPALAGSALLVVLAWPLQVLSVSFRMSYGIMAALLLFGLPLAETWQGHWQPFRSLPLQDWRWYHHLVHRLGRALAAAAAIGLASSLVSTLSSVWHFQLFTPGALVPNLLLIPLASLVILAGMASLLCGLVGIAAWSVLFNHAAVLMLWSMEAGIRVWVTLPGTWSQAHFVAPWLGPTAFVALLATLLAGYARRWRPACGGWWPPVIVVVVVVIFGVEFN